MSQLEDLYKNKPSSTSAIVALDDQTRNQLEALGYLVHPEDASDNKDDNDKEIVETNKPKFIKTKLFVDIDEDMVFDKWDTCIDTDWDGFGNPNQLTNKCKKDNCPNIFNPDQKDSNGDGKGDACIDSISEYHWLEAENAYTSINPLGVANNKNASEGKYLHSPDGIGNQYSPSSVMATYQVKILQEGIYVLWGRVKVHNYTANSFFVQVDNGIDNLWEIEKDINWHWERVNDRYRANPVKFFLEEGLHTIKIKLREDGTKLDKMLLTDDIGFIPRNKGALAENQVYFEGHRVVP